HDAMELTIRLGKNQWQEIAIPFPQRQIEDMVHRDPFERTLHVLPMRRSVPAVDAKNEAKPVGAVFAEARPTDGASQGQGSALQPRFLADFSAHAGDHVFARFDLATQTVVFTKMQILRPAVAMDEQHLRAV